jgi:hypothetical protein
MLAMCRIMPDGTYVELCRFEEISPSQPISQPKADVVDLPPGFEGTLPPGIRAIEDRSSVAWYNNWIKSSDALGMKDVIDLSHNPLTLPAPAEAKRTIWTHLDTLPRPAINRLCAEIGIKNIKAELTVGGYIYILYRIYHDKIKG